MTEPERPATAADDSLGLQRLVLAIVQAVNNCALYPASHPRVAEAVERLVANLESLLIARHQHAINLLMVDDDMVVDQQPFRYAGLHLGGFLHAMTQLGVEGLTFSRGLDVEECTEFLASISERSTAVSTAHVQVGRIKLAFTGEGDDEGGGEGDGGGGRAGALAAAAAERIDLGREGVLEGRIEAAREAFTRLRADRKGGLPQLESLVWGFIDGLGRGARFAHPLGSLRSADERLYVHSVNVALLVLAHAKALGFRGELLNELGLAALLHDIGKLDLPPALLAKEGPLDEAEWRVMRRHPELGTARLCELDATTTLAALVAFEHHLRYDGGPSFPLLRTPRRPILASLLTAVADTFDCVLNARPSGRTGTLPAAFQAVRQRAGTWLDPLLVESFCRLYEAPAS